jgi:hypothetical protein
MKSPWVSRDHHTDLLAQLAAARELIARMGENHRAVMIRLGDDHRRAMEAMEGHVVRILENHEIEVDRAERRYADLMASYRLMKLQGAVEAPAPPRVEPKPIDAVEAAIREECAGKDAAVAAAMRKQVAVDRAMGMKEEEIIRLIRRGERPAEESAP